MRTLIVAIGSAGNDGDSRADQTGGTIEDADGRAAEHRVHLF